MILYYNIHFVYIFNLITLKRFFIQIFRVQNSHLYCIYQEEKKFVKKSLEGRCQNLPIERHLWYAPRSQDVSDINLNGFDYSCVMKRGMF